MTERARHAKRADDLPSRPFALRALKPVSQDATPVPLHAGHVTHRRFLNFSPLPVSHHPPLPSQPEHGFGFGASSLAMLSAWLDAPASSSGSYRLSLVLGYDWLWEPFGPGSKYVHCLPAQVFARRDLTEHPLFYRMRQFAVELKIFKTVGCHIVAISSEH